MNLKKKLSLITAIAMCATVGGVYAMWTYVGKGENYQEVNKNINLTPAVEEGAYGTYDIQTTGLDFDIDQMADGDYRPKMIYGTFPEIHNGNLYISFTPSIVATVEIEAVGLTSYVSFNSTAMYEGNNIFIFPSTITIGTSDSNETYKWAKNGSGVFEVEIPMSAIENCIKINEEAGFYLDTKTEYDNFNAALNIGFNVKISDKAPVTE